MGCDEAFKVKQVTHATEFQSTHPHGVRRVRANLDKDKAEISIHAPTWGATSDKEIKAVLYIHFNPRTHMGCDTTACWPTDCSNDFNPRTHMGCDNPRPCISCRRSPFQSTHPHGVRPNYHFGGSNAKNISIHAPTWGATPAA